MPGNLQSIPASVVANWPTPNYIDPTRRTWMPVLAGVFQAVTTLMLSTRLCLRAKGRAGGFGLDDALLIPAFLAGTAFTVLCMLGTERYGMDRHLYNVPITTFEYTALVGWAAQVAFIISTCCTKISVLLFYRRLTEGTCHKLWKYLTIGAVVFTFLYGCALVLALVFNCSPTQAYWKSYSLEYPTKYYCADTTVLNPLSGALSILSDLYSVLLPMGIMAGLNATTRQKWALNAVFSLGLLVVAAGIARTYYLESLGKAWDITWLGFDVLVWSQVELQLAIICASAPALRVLFRSYLSKPMTRAMNSAKLSSNKSVRRISRPSDTEAIVSYAAERTSEQDEEDLGLNKEVEINVKGVDDIVAVSSSHTWQSAASITRTPGEYESFALDTLREQHKQYIVWASAPRS